MTAELAEIDGLSVVLLGSFNPAIFQPFWFARHKLVGDEEAGAATIELVRPELTRCIIGPFTIQVMPQQAAFESDVGKQGPLRDLVTGTFDVLRETPVKALGINRFVHFRASKQRMDAIGHALAPPSAWSTVLGAKPEMRGLISWGHRKGGGDARFQVTVQPSARLKLGVHIAANEHHEFAGEAAATAVTETLAKHYDHAIHHASIVAQHVMGLGVKTP